MRLNPTVMIPLLVGLVVSAMVCIIIRDLLKASIALAVVSAILAIIMFLSKAPLAAVFELSVCAGLITVVFISAISMTRIRSKEEVAQMEKERRKRFALLPVILIVLLAGVLFAIWPHLNALIPYKAAPLGTATEQNFFWNKRQVDLLGQIIIILAGVYGVLIFFKDHDLNNNDRYNIRLCSRHVTGHIACADHKQRYSLGEYFHRNQDPHEVARYHHAIEAYG